MLLRKGRNWRYGLFLAAALTVLFFSFSRSAWIGAILSIVALLFLSRLSRRSQRIALAVIGSLAIAGLILTITLRHSPAYQNFVFHTQTQSSVKTTSNENHFMALKQGVNDLRHHPLGEGPGTAGPASLYNDHKIRLAENYFVQAGQETGWLGLLLFILINLGVGALLYVRRGDPLALSLFASLIGLTFVNLLWHAWTDDTLAYVWWGLAGVAMAPLMAQTAPPPVPAVIPAQPKPKKAKSGVKAHSKR
jgi:ABC-type multidrug transport system fused ATPase/permease subunit